MRGVSPSEGRPKGRAKGVFITTLEVVGAGFALFCTGVLDALQGIEASDILLALVPPQAPPTSQIL